MKKILKTSNYYSADFKEQVLQEVLNGQISAEGARKKYKIGGKMTIYRWLAQYREKENILFLSDMKKEAKKTKGQNESSDELEKLKEQLEEALLQAEAYKTLLEIGKEKYGIDLEKKLGAKQLKD